MSRVETATQGLVSLHDAYYSYRDKVTLCNISLRLEWGSEIVLLGENGSGKSTLLALLAGILLPTRGKRVMREGLHLGYYGHNLLVYLDFTPVENLNLFSRLLGMQESIAPLLEEWGLQKALDKPLRELSQGTRAKVALCRAFMGNPDVLLLDEPTATLDAAGVERLQANLKERRRLSKASIISTHEPLRLGSFGNSTLELQNGQIVSECESASTLDNEGRP